MPRIDTSSRRKGGPYKNDLHEARPLLQAIFLGMLLASALVAAAAMANPSKSEGTGQIDAPVQERTMPHPAPETGLK